MPEKLFLFANFFVAIFCLQSLILFALFYFWNLFCKNRFGKIGNHSRKDEKIRFHFQVFRIIPNGRSVPRDWFDSTLLTLGAGGPEPAELAVALLAGRAGGLHVHAPAAVTAVAAVDALVPELAARPVVQPVAPALAQQVPPVARAVLLEVFRCGAKFQQVG